MRLVPPTDPVLWTKAEPVSDMDAIQAPILQMQTLLTKRKGAGLAAPQVGIPLRFFVWQGGVVINPVIHQHSQDMIEGHEGCLSFPGLSAPIRRWKLITCSWTDHFKVAHMQQMTDLAARIFAHEIDHLDGVCIFSRPKSQSERINELTRGTFQSGRI